MSEFDLSQVDQGLTGDDLFPQVEASGENKQRVSTQQSLIMKGMLSDPAEATIMLSDPNTQLMLQQEVDALTSPAGADIQDAMMERMGITNNTPQVYEAAVEDVSEVIKEPDYVEKAVVETLNTDADERTVTHETARLYAARKVQEMVDSQGLGSDILDFAGFMIPFGYTKDLADVPDGTFDWTNAIDVEGMIIDYQSLSPEEKIKVFPGLMEAVLEATATAGLSDQNRLKAATILQQFFDPQGELNTTTERVIDVGFSALDVVPVGAITKGVKGSTIGKRIMGGAAVRLKAKTNTANVAAAVGNKAKAAEATIAAANNADLSKVHGIPRDTAGQNALALNRTDFDLSATPEINDVISKSLNEFTRQSDELTRRIIDDQQLLRIGALNPSEKKQFIKNWIGRTEANVSDVFNDEVHVMNMKIHNVDEVGFTATYDLKHINELSPQKVAALRKKRLTLESKLEKAAKGEKAELQSQLDDVVAQLEINKANSLQRVGEQVKFTVDENGNFNYTMEHSKEAQRALGSPSFWSYTKDGGDFNDSFKSAGVTTDLEAAFGQQIEQMVVEAWKPVGGIMDVGKRKRVESVLLAGDVKMDTNGMRGYVFSPNELIAGVDTGNGIVRLTDPSEIEAYYRVRAVADNFWRLENHAAKRRLELNGFSNSIKLDEGDYAAVRPIENASSAKQSVRNRSDYTGGAAFDNSEGRIVDITDELIDEQYAQNKVLVRTSDSKEVHPIDGETEFVDYIFVDRSSLAPLPEQVTHFKRGYVPKINKGVEYLVKEAYPIAKRGAKSPIAQKTLRFFASQKDAERFAEQAAIRAFDEGRYDSLEAARAAIKPVADRELTPMQRVHEPIGASGGLFTGARSSDDILTGLRGEYTERVGVYEAMSRNARHLGSLVARNESRIGDEQRWLHSVEAAGIENHGFLGTKLPEDEIGRTLRDMRNQIKAWNGVPQVDESAWQGVIQNLHDWTLEGARKLPGLQNKDSIKSLLWLKHKDLAAAVKTATMHTVLGMLSPAQLFVQGSAMSVAISRYPKYAHHMIHYGFRMGVADLIKDTDSLKALTKHMDAGADSNLFSELYAAWERSGLRESVRSNADLQVAENYGFLVAKGKQAAGNVSLSLYRNGELMNRRAAFITSYLSKRDELGRKLTPEELIDVRKDANLTMLELNSANRAWWQGGPGTGSIRQMLGVMTQFQQVSAKSIELLWKGAGRGGFTPREKLRILAGQVALFGVAGLPFGAAITNAIMQGAGTEMTQDELNQWRQGLVIGSFLNALDMDVDVTERVTAFGQIGGFINDMLFDDVPMIEQMLGPAYGVGSRAATALKEIKPLVMGAYRERDLSALDVQVALNVLGKVPTASRNGLKAWIMHNQHVIRDRHGNIIPDDYSIGTEIGVALGFRPSLETETRALQMSMRDQNELVQEVANTYIYLANTYLDAMNSGDQSATDQAALDIEATMSYIASSVADNPIIMNKVYERIQEKIAAPTDLRERALKEYFESTLPEKIYEGALIDRKGLLGQTFNQAPLVSPAAREVERLEEGEE